MTVNGTSSCVMKAYRVSPMTYVGVPLSCLVIVQTLLTVTTIYRSAALHTTTNMLMVSLTFVDVLVVLVYSVTGIIYLPEMTHLSSYTTAVDALMLGAYSSTLILSMTHFGMISIDRYIYIAHPFYYTKNITTRLILKVICGCWFVAILDLIFPVLIYRNSIYHKRCILSNPPKEYFGSGAVLYHVIVIIVFICYFKIAKFSFKLKRATNALEVTFSDSGQAYLFQKNRQAAMKSVKFFAIMFGTFSLCTLPASWSVALNYFMPLSYNIYFPLFCLFLVNPVLGFYIHIYMNKAFSHCLKKTILDLKCSCTNKK